MSDPKFTFFDPVELEDIDINDPRVKFYLIDVTGENGNNPGFKFCATIQDLSRLNADPETRQKKYWPVTREQLNKENRDVLFSEPDEASSHRKMRARPFKTAQEVNEAFHFDPPFDPLTTETRNFGQSSQQEQQERIRQELRQGREGTRQANFEAIIQRQNLETVTRAHQERRRTNHLYNEQEYDERLRDPARILATEREITNAVEHYEGLFTAEDIAGIERNSAHYLIQPQCLDAIREGVITAADIARCANQHVAYQMIQPQCLNAIRESRTTVDQLLNMTAGDLSHANQTGEYPENPEEPSPRPNRGL
jgi:hypothetical protein